MNNVKEYEICKVRGHSASGIQMMSNPPYGVCKYCGTGFRYEVTRELKEVMAPPPFPLSKKTITTIAQ